MTIKNNQKYDACIFEDDIQLSKFFEKHEAEVVRVSYWDIEDTWSILWIDRLGEPHVDELKTGYYVWFDEFHQLCFCTKECFKENYKVVKD